MLASWCGPADDPLCVLRAVAHALGMEQIVVLGFHEATDFNGVQLVAATPTEEFFTAGVIEGPAAALHNRQGKRPVR